MNFNRKLNDSKYNFFALTFQTGFKRDRIAGALVILKSVKIRDTNAVEQNNNHAVTAHLVFNGQADEICRPFFVLAQRDKVATDTREFSRNNRSKLITRSLQLILQQH